MTDTTPDYKTGDMASGHVLTEHGWVPTTPGPAVPEAPKAKKPIYKRWWAIGLAAIFVIVGISQAVGGSDEGQADAPRQAAEQTAPKAEKPVEEKPAEPEMTSGQENALRAAENYLSMMPFSHAGLIEQLSSDFGDGYSVKDAAFAADHVDVNWNEQAAKAAKNYLDMTPFSRAGLIKQLSSNFGDGFTRAQAIYGVNQSGL